MSDLSLFHAPAVSVPVPEAGPAHRPPSGMAERRRPGRMAHASPELITLMRKPSQAARLRVALYDAPGFVLPERHGRRPVSGLSLARMAGAVAACSGGCAVMFKAMLVMWG